MLANTFYCMVITLSSEGIISRYLIFYVFARKGDHKWSCMPNLTRTRAILLETNQFALYKRSISEAGNAYSVFRL